MRPLIDDSKHFLIILDIAEFARQVFGCVQGILD